MSATRLGINGTVLAKTAPVGPRRVLSRTAPVGRLGLNDTSWIEQHCLEQNGTSWDKRHLPGLLAYRAYPPSGLDRLFAYRASPPIRLPGLSTEQSRALCLGLTTASGNWASLQPSSKACSRPPVLSHQQGGFGLFGVLHERLDSRRSVIELEHFVGSEIR